MYRYTVYCEPPQQIWKNAVFAMTEIKGEPKGFADHNNVVSYISTYICWPIEVAGRNTLRKGIYEHPFTYIYGSTRILLRTPGSIDRHYRRQCM